MIRASNGIEQRGKKGGESHGLPKRPLTILLATHFIKALEDGYVQWNPGQTVQIWSVWDHALCPIKIDPRKSAEVKGLVLVMSQE
jgi:hypothetical protein